MLKHIFINKIGTITNQHIFASEILSLFIPVKKPCFRIQWSLEKHFLPSAGCGNIFPEKSCQDAWRNGSGLSKGQVNMADEAKLCSPIHSTFEALILGLAVRHCHGEELGPFCSSADCRYCSFWWSHWFAEHTFQV